jgi:hypothetical protein
MSTSCFSRRTTILTAFILSCGVGLATGPLVSAAPDDPKGIREGQEELERLAKRFNGEHKTTIPVSLDWNRLKANFVRDWGTYCAQMYSAFNEICEDSHSKVIPSCIAAIASRVQRLVCVPIEDNAEGHSSTEIDVTLKNKTLTFRLGKSVVGRGGGWSSIAKKLNKLWPDLQSISTAVDAEATLSEEAKSDDENQRFGTHIKLEVDRDSLSKATNGGQVATMCLTFWDVARGLTASDCPFKMCKGDSKRGTAFLKKLDKVVCKYSATERAPEINGSTLTYYITGGSISPASSAYMALRKPLKIRGCSFDPLSKDLLFTADGPMKEACCPRDSKNRCMVRKNQPEHECRVVDKTEYEASNHKRGKTCGMYDKFFWSDTQLKTAR